MLSENSALNWTQLRKYRSSTKHNLSPRWVGPCIFFIGNHRPTSKQCLTYLQAMQIHQLQHEPDHTVTEVKRKLRGICSECFRPIPSTEENTTLPQVSPPAPPPQPVPPIPLSPKVTVISLAAQNCSTSHRPPTNPCAPQTPKSQKPSLSQASVKNLPLPYLP